MCANARKLMIAAAMLPALLTSGAVLAASCGDALTNDNKNQSGANRHSFTSQGNVLWFDDAGVYYFDGVDTNGIWAVDPNLAGHENVEDFVFGLGNGAQDGAVIGLWRAGTDFAWIWRNDGNEPQLVNATNPIDANEPLNPEGVAIADGCVFVVLQAFSGGQAVKHVFQVDPDTAEATNLTGNDPVPGVDGRVRTGGCQAAWPFDDGSGDIKLHFYDGSTVTTIDTNGYPKALVDGALVYTKLVGTVDHVFLYDSKEATPAPVQISPDDGRPNLSPQTDGRHVAWIHANPDGSERRIMLYGGLVLSDQTSHAAAQPQNTEAPLQLNRGQLLWEDVDGALRYYHDGETEIVCDPSDTQYEEAWLTDGFVVFAGVSADTGADSEIFRMVGTPPSDSAQPAAPLLVRATPGDGEATLEWDTVIGATGYRVYVAQQPGVTASNFATLPAGRMLPADASPFVVPCLADATYYVVLTTVEGENEGPESAEISLTPTAGAPDADTDGTPDCLDDCPDDPQKTAPGACGCDVPDADGDGDAVPDCLDECPSDPTDQCLNDNGDNANTNGNANDNTADNDNTGGNDNTAGGDNANTNGNDNGSGGDQTQDGQTACGAGACGAGTATMLPLMVSALWSTSRRRRPRVYDRRRQTPLVRF